MNNRARLAYIAVADALLLLVGVIGVISVNPSDDSVTTPLAALSDSTTIASATTAPATTASPAASGTTVKGKKATAAPLTPAAGAAGAGGAGPAGVRPPKDGSYRTKIHIESHMMEKNSSDREVTSTYATVKSTPSEIEQKVTRKTSGESSGSSGQPSSMFWRPTGVYQPVDTGGGPSSCQPNEQLVLKLPLAQGVTWTNTLDCTMSMNGTTATTHVESTSKVVGQKQTQVAGKTVQVWEITSTSKTSSTSNGQDVKGSGEGKHLFAPDHGLFVHEEQSQKGGGGAQTFTFKSVSDLQNLDPA